MLAGARYRETAEIDEWRARDPIARLASELISSGAADAAALEALDVGVRQRVADAVAFAEAGEPADPDLALTLMFAGEGA